jgi:hypothetical protein
MPRAQSKAQYRSARFNPINPEDRDVLAIIHELEGKGYNFKQIVTDAILRADGRTPEMYAAPQITADLIKAYMNEVLPQFAQEIVSHVKRGGAVIEDEPEDAEGKPSKFAQSFANSFLERQRRAMGDGE